MKIMTYSEYEKVEHKIPYTFVLEVKNNFIFYFGEKHSFNPKDEQWIEEKTFWQEFTDKTKNKKRIVFIEGGLRPKEESEEQYILKHGGMGLATWLATGENIEIHTPEPDEKYERTELEKIYARNQIQYYYFARMVYQWCRMEIPKPSFSDYINDFLKSDKKESGWEDFDFTLTNMLKIHKENFTVPFDENNTEFFYDVCNPVVLKYVFNEISQTSSNLRDEYIVKEIQKYVEQGYSIFLQYGCSHAVMQEPVLRALNNNL